MKNKNLSNDILNRIKKENIKPIPKIVFILIFVWKLFLIFSLSLLTSIFVSILVFHFANIETLFFEKIWIFKTLEILLPFFWILLVLISSGFTYYLFYKLLNGYRYRFSIVIITNFIIYLILWIWFFQFDIPDKIEQLAIANIKDEKLKDFLSLEYRLEKLWQNPEEWMLWGKILKVQKDKMLIEDFKWKKWIIEFYKWTLIDKRLFSHNIKKVKIEWLMKNDHTFIATKISPFGVKKLIEKLYQQKNWDVINKNYFEKNK